MNRSIIDQQRSKVLAKRLYKLLFRATKPLFHKNHIEFLNEVATIFQDDILKLSCGKQFLIDCKSEPSKALRDIFRNGNYTDNQICLDMIPQLLRFMRGAKLIQQEDLFRIPRKWHSLGSLRSPYNLAAAGLLSTKLFAYEAQSQNIQYERMHRDYLEKSIAYVRRSINRAILDRRRESWALGANLSPEDLRRMRVYYMYLSLDRLYWLWDISKL